MLEFYTQYQLVSFIKRLISDRNIRNLWQMSFSCPIIFSVSPADDAVTFSVGPLTGEVSANGTVDREAISRYLVIVNVSLHVCVCVCVCYGVHVT